MEQFNMNLEEKNIISGLDRLLISVGLAFIALLPTHFYLIFKPRALVHLLRGDTAEGRHAIKLGPGVTFVLTFLFLLGVSYFFRDVLEYRPATTIEDKGSSGIRSAISEGNIWRSIILALPFYLTALVFGLLLHTCHFVLRLKSDLVASVGAGFYLLSTILLFVVPLGVMEETQVPSKIQAIITTVLLMSLVFAVWPWQIYNVSKHAFNNSKGKAILVALVFWVSLLVLIPTIGATIFALSQGAETLGAASP